MQFFEMIHRNGLYHTISGFYKTNSVESRSHFVEKLIEASEKDLERSRKEGSIYVLSETELLERQKVILNLKDEFVVNGESRDGTYVSIRVIAKEMTDL